MILGGRRDPDIPGRSHNVCLLSTSRPAEVACGSSRREVGGGRDDSTDCGGDEGGRLSVADVSGGTGCVAFGGELDVIDRAGGEDFGGKNTCALGFNGALESEVVAERGGSGTVLGGESVNEGSGFVAGGPD